MASKGILERLLMSVLAASVMGASCDDPAPAIEARVATPLPQESVVLVEVEAAGGTWVTMPIPQEGMERFARKWCAYERSDTSDARMCRTQTVPTAWYTEDFDPATASLSSFSSCRTNLCRERNELCAGFLLEEIARSPIQRTFDARDLGLNSFELDALLGVSDQVRRTALAKADAPANTTTVRRIRSQPMRSPSKAAALRGALNRYRESGLIGHALQDGGGRTSGTCLEYFRTTTQSTLLLADEDGHVPNWVDVYFMTFTDAANQFSAVLPRTLGAMRDSAGTQLQNPDELGAIATQWNGSVDSALAIAKLLGHGGPPESGAAQSLSIQTDCGEDHKAADIGPKGLPVCPPLAEDEKTKLMVELLMQLQKKTTTVDPLGEITAAKSSELQALGVISQPLTQAQFLELKNVTQENVQKAAAYQCLQAKATGTFLLPQPSGTPYQKFFGTFKPIGTLPAPVLASHFTGSPDISAAKIGTSAYAKSGAVRTLDLFKKTGDSLSKSSASQTVSQKVAEGLKGVIEGLALEAGKRRLEFVVGLPTTDGLAVEHVAVIIHGVPDSAGAAGEQYYLVSGLMGLKCAAYGNVDGAPCDPADYLEDLNQGGSFSSTADARMTDLSGGYLRKEVATIRRPGNAAAPIDPEQGLYVLRLEGGQRVPFGGVVPGAGTLAITLPPELAWVAWPAARQVITPVGGTYEQVLQNAVTPNSDDCSKQQTTCAGLPADIWPPLESELVGTGSPNAQPFEQSWRYYLDLAKAAAAEADKLGEELVSQGLEMDLRREELKDKLLALCGADETGCGGAVLTPTGELDQGVYATLGDKDVCLWKRNGKLCDRSGGIADSVPCPFVLPPNVFASESTCQSNHPTALTGATFVPVTRKFGLIKTSATPGTEGECYPFTALRYDSVPELQALDSEKKPLKRADFIRTYIMPRFDQGIVQQIAKDLVYEELFADNFELRAAGNPVFSTRRRYVGAANDLTPAPCTVSDEDRATGSKFWGQNGIRCFTSGVAPAPGQPACPPPDGVGKDGCGSGNEAELSYDTEQDALRRRWAWGFGELRRSMAVLGFLTGELTNNMVVARVITPFESSYSNLPGKIEQNDDAGRPCKPSETIEPLWILHCTALSEQQNFARAMCVRPTKVPGLGTDLYRKVSGRPVNQNAFIPNALPQFGITDGAKAGDGVYEKFPVLCAGPTCQFGGVDPQMPYCDMIDPYEVDVWPTATFPYEYFDSKPVGPKFQYGPGNPYVSSAFIGVSLSGGAQVTKASKYAELASELWKTPAAEEDFCAASAVKTISGAVWRALCLAPGDEGLSAANPPILDDSAFMNFGEFTSTAKEGHEYLDRTAVGALLGTKDTDYASPDYAQMLFDLRKGWDAGGKLPFQYPLTQRNIFDALELACHASVRASIGTAVNCDAIDPLNLPADSFDTLGGVLDCLSHRVARQGERFVVGPIDEQLVKVFAAGGAISSTSGLGGEYLDKLKKQFEALKTINRQYSALREANVQLGFRLRQLKQIENFKDAIAEAGSAQKHAAWLQAVAQADLAFASNNGINLGPIATGAAALLASAGESVKAIESQTKAQVAQGESQKLDTMSAMVAAVSAASAAADGIVLAMNDLTQATADLALVKKQAGKYSAGLVYAGYANGDKNDPQYVNVAMRRIYNTKLVRYEDAFERAKRLAFLARRAIELRFGVDLQRINKKMTLTEAPNTWANQICDLQGINYADLRQPDESELDAGVTWQPAQGELLPPKESFATSFVGDYVQKLEDFVNSYPIDFPLKDGDDIGVVSLADDIFAATAKCTKPGPNIVYFSTEFDKGDGGKDNPGLGGWFVSGCGLTLPPSDGGAPDGGAVSEWNGCVGVQPAPVVATAAADAGVGDGGVTTSVGLPAAAVAYRIRSEPCVPGAAPSGESVICPSVSNYSSIGYLAQRLVGLGQGHHRASIYALAEPNAIYAAGNSAAMRVVRESDGVVAGQVPIQPIAAAWTRTDLVFEAALGESYRLEFAPATSGQTLDPPGTSAPTWPAVLIAAAQVESVGLSANGTPAAASAWTRTDASRDVIDPVCHALRGPAFRSRFTRRCEYVCSDGIQKTCAGIDTSSMPKLCFYEAPFSVNLRDIESGSLVPSGQIATGNFNFRHNQIGLNAVGTGVSSCDGKPGSCFYNGFIEYSLFHEGKTSIRNYTGATMAAHLDGAVVEHGKMLAAERVLTNPPSSADVALMDPYMKQEFKGRPLEGSYTIRIWDKPGLRWEAIEDIQFAWRYHYWTRFAKAQP